jgi:hypothetical protein
MKLRQKKPAARVEAGILLIECLVYMAVFFILLGIALTAFYICWDRSETLLYTTDSVESALRAGERWRVDVRGATRKISVETGRDGEFLRIPRGRDEISYSFHDGTVRRKLASQDFSELLSIKIKSSQMETEMRNQTVVCRWELELKPPPKDAHLPLLFTFEAVPAIKP